MIEPIFEGTPSTWLTGGAIGAGGTTAFTYAERQRGLQVYNNTGGLVCVELEVGSSASTNRNVHMVRDGSSLFLRHLEFVRFVVSSQAAAIVEGVGKNLTVMAYARLGLGTN